MCSSDKTKVRKFPRLPYWAYAVLTVLALALALGLQYLRPDRFPLRCTFPATIVYVTVYTLICLCIPYLIPRSRESGRTVSPIGPEKWGIDGFLAEVIFFLLAAGIGAVSGAAAGAAWWIAGASEYRTLAGCIYTGAFLGGSAPIALFAGG
jgi:hypothetical protein